MRKLLCCLIPGALAILGMGAEARAQANPHIGFVYPAGGQVSTTFQVRLGGQRLTHLEGAIVSGDGVQAKRVEYRRKLSNQDRTFLQEQLKDLKRKYEEKPQEGKKGAKGKQKPAKEEEPPMMEMMDQDMMSAGPSVPAGAAAEESAADKKLRARIRARLDDYCNRPANASLAEIAIVDVTVDTDATPGRREIRLVTGKGISNPLVFYIGQFPEVARRPMKTQPFQILGKEKLAQRKRPPEEAEARITVPCTLNGQIASGEVNRYRFTASKGQRLVISVAARELIPYIADAVPGWFQPVLTLRDTQGTEVAFNDDFRFKPDPLILHDVKQDGEYVLSITDALYRGREDFVYRITIAESPFVTSIFPLGARAGTPAQVKMQGWNLGDATLTLPSTDAAAGMHRIFADRKDLISNHVPFTLDTLPECFEKEPNGGIAQAQKIRIPVIINGRMNSAGDWDVFQIEGQVGSTVVVEVQARRLDSPMDSLVQVTDATGKVLAFNDDRRDPASGLNTHHADSYLAFTPPTDGRYYVRLGDTERRHGAAYAYRLRISPPRPDFELRIVPSCTGMRGKGGRAVEVFAIRKDGFAGPITLALAHPPEGIRSRGATLPEGEEKVRFAMNTTRTSVPEPVALSIEGTATIEGKTIVRTATPAEDKMQAFLWRHLVPAEDFLVRIFARNYKPEVSRPLPTPPEKPARRTAAADADEPAPKKEFSEKQVANFMKQMKRLHGEWLVSDEFYLKKVGEYDIAPKPKTAQPVG